MPVVLGAPVDNASWLRPAAGSGDLFATYSLMLALFLGTMGLPHVLVRFYTNPDGRAARRTTLHVLLLLVAVLPVPDPARRAVPAVRAGAAGDRQDRRGRAAAAEQDRAGLLGEILGAITAAGAFAAFLSTSSGLVVSVSGVLSTDVLRGRVRDFRFATAIAGGAPLALAIVLRPQDISLSVGMSFALAASTFCPVLLLGVWWRKLTWVGAAAGMIVGGGLVLASLVLNTVSGFTGNWAPGVVGQPALITVPIAFLTVVAREQGDAEPVAPRCRADPAAHARSGRARFHPRPRGGAVRHRGGARAAGRRKASEVRHGSEAR